MALGVVVSISGKKNSKLNNQINSKPLLERDKAYF
jgi:hypothetical protein